MKNLDELVQTLSDENFNAYKPQQRDELLSTYLAILICKELRSLNENLTEIKDALKLNGNVKQEIPVTVTSPVSPNKPGRKPKENKEE